MLPISNDSLEYNGNNVALNNVASLGLFFLVLHCDITISQD